MASFLSSASAENDTSGTTLDITPTLTSGSLIVCLAKWEGANGAVATVAKSDGTNAFTMRTVQNHTNNDLHIQAGYMLTHSMSGSTTLRFTLDAARSWRRFVMIEFAYSGQMLFDNDRYAIGTTGTLNTGSMVVDSKAQVVLGLYGEYSTSFVTSEQINSVAADGSKIAPTAPTKMWYRLISGGFTGAATANTASTSHLSAIVSFRVAPTLTADSGVYSTTGFGSVLRPGSDLYLRYRK